MSDPWTPPARVIRVGRADASPIVRLPARVPSPATRVVIAGPMGPQGIRGEKGDVGQDAVDVGFGSVTYTDRVSGMEDRFEAGVRQVIRFAPTTTTTRNKLLPPFDGHQFLASDRLMARAMDDVYRARINLVVRADAAGTKIKVDCDAGSSLGPIQADDKTLFYAAGIPERLTFSFEIQVLENTLANGALFYLQATGGVDVLAETLFVIPSTVQPAVS